MGLEPKGGGQRDSADLKSETAEHSALAKAQSRTRSATHNMPRTRSQHPEPLSRDLRAGVNDSKLRSSATKKVGSSAHLDTTLQSLAKKPGQLHRGSSRSVMDKELLIHCVRAERAVWDKRHPHHHHVNILAKHWKNIAEKVGKPEKEARATWKNLRQEFKKQWRKCCRLGGAAPDEEVVSGWLFYAAMDFLVDQFQPSDMTGNTQSRQDSQNLIPSEDDVEESLPPPSTPQDPELSPPPSPALSQSSSGPQPQSCQSSTSASRQRKTQQAVMGEALLSIEKQKLELRRSMATEPEDDTMLFLKSLAPQMRKLDPQRNMLFRTEMQGRLYELLYPPCQPVSLPPPMSPKSSNTV